MLGKSVLTAVALSAVGLVAFASDFAQAGGTILAPLRALSIQSDAIEVKSHKGGSQQFGGGYKSSSKQSRGSPKFSSQGGSSYKQFKSSSSKFAPHQYKYKSSSQIAPQQYKYKPSSQIAPQHYKYKSSSQFSQKYKGDYPKKNWLAKRVRSGIRFAGSHRYLGSYFIVPYGTYLYANHYCYDYFYGPYGLGYYWNYDRCPIDPHWLY
jgi:hypothetical protein